MAFVYVPIGGSLLLHCARRRVFFELLKPQRTLLSTIAFDIDVDVNCGTVLISYDVLNVISFSRYFSVASLFAPRCFDNVKKFKRQRIP